MIEKGKQLLPSNRAGRSSSSPPFHQANQLVVSLQCKRNLSVLDLESKMKTIQHEQINNLYWVVLLVVFYSKLMFFGKCGKQRSTPFAWKGLKKHHRSPFQNTCPRLLQWFRTEVVFLRRATGKKKNQLWAGHVTQITSWINPHCHKKRAYETIQQHLNTNKNHRETVMEGHTCNPNARLCVRSEGSLNWASRKTQVLNVSH